MDEVHIPSPTVFLQKTPPSEPAPEPVVKIKRPRVHNNAATISKGSTGAVLDGAVAKPKQSKSRNGCMTCKKKRLKCDEVKPGCLQCQKRNVECEGYKKDYKWRTFEETTFISKSATKARKATLLPEPSEPAAPSQEGQKRSSDDSEFSRDSSTLPRRIPTKSLRSYSLDLYSNFPTVSGDFGTLPQSLLKTGSYDSYQHNATAVEVPSFSQFDSSTPQFSSSFTEPFDFRNLSSTGSTSPTFDNASTSNSVSTFSSGSPRLLDLLLPGTDLNQPPDPSEQRPPPSPLPYQPGGSNFNQDFDPLLTADDDFDEEIVRDLDITNQGPDQPFSSDWTYRLPSPVPSDSSSSSSSSGNTLIAQPRLQPESPEMLTLRFDRDTCGILSVKDGPTENPWRNLIWPLAGESPALYHAISSMTAFHASRRSPEMRVPGMAHMNSSIRNLTTEISNMSLDAALATALALAFSESWDVHVSTGIQHLRGAKELMNNAIVRHKNASRVGQLTALQATRTKFLCNTFIYMDVIARLTSLEEDNELYFYDIMETINSPFGDLVEVDPLMGCATTLFPLIGRVANVIQKARKTDSNTLGLVSQATDLKELVQQWQVPDAVLIERPEDPSSDVQHSIQTAEAYRYATLLYLHQAVPEIPSESALDLAMKVLMRIVSVPMYSRTTIVHIFPLLAASCELVREEDRSWAVQRWEQMISRMSIGNVESCLKVVREVWSRRDQHEAEKAERLLRRFPTRSVPGVDFVPPMLGNSKRKANTVDITDNEAFLAANNIVDDGMMNDNCRPLKRRMTMDSFGQPLSMSMPIPSGAGTQPGSSRRPAEAPNADTDPEYTVRGRLHWIGVMQDWNWEVLLG